MRHAYSFVFLMLSISGLTFGQNYTVKSYTDRVSYNITYGADTTFSGTLDSLKLDIYKPVGDNNCRRPIAVLVHGGAWLAGTKADGNIVAIAHEMAKRGYVVAAINYRLGMHPANYYVPYAICPQAICSYVADSAEFYRALYRAAQDVKGAIRFMKNRAMQDSSDVANVFLVGESAGAFTCMLAAWLDKASEKFTQCFALPDAPTPDSDLATCSPNNYRKRPDLGDINGKLNLGNNHSRVQGVAAFYGGVLDPKVFENSNALDTPILYNYHQTCDVVVDSEKGRLFWKVYYHCYAPLNLCQPYTVAPISWGSNAIKKYLDTAGTKTGQRKITMLTAGGAYSCDVNSNCHGIDNVSARVKEYADMFASRIYANGNTPSSDCSLILPGKQNVSVKDILVYPTTFVHQFFIQQPIGVEAKAAKVQIIDVIGKSIDFSIEVLDGRTLAITTYGKPGLYVVKVLINGIGYSSKVLNIN